MSDQNISEQLHNLFSELNRSEEERQQSALQRRLQQRATQYAAPYKTKEASASQDTYTVLSFLLGDEQYGIDVQAVRSVRDRGRVTRVPGTPAFYPGVVNVRGQIISVLDLRAIFGQVDTSSKLPAELIVASASDLELGLLADHVEEVQVIPKDRIEFIDMTYARGITSERLIILDIDSLFADERLVIGGKNDS